MPTRSSISTARTHDCFLLASWWMRYASTICAPIEKNGCRADSGSWKIIDILLPRSRRTSSASAPTSSTPSSQISPEILARVPLCRPRTAWLVTDLPQPDSPTIPNVRPLARWKLIPSTLRTSPSSVGKWTFRSRTSRNAVARDAGAPSGATSIAVNGCFPSGRGLPRCRRRPASAVPHSGVNDGVEHVDDDVRHDQEDCPDDDHAHDDRQVELVDRIDRQLAQALQAEGLLGEDGAAEQTAEVEAEDGDDRGERGAQGVLAHHRPGRQALGPRGPDVVLPHRLQHV